MSADLFREPIPAWRVEQLRILKLKWKLYDADFAIAVFNHDFVPITYHLHAVPEPFRTIIRNALQAMEDTLTKEQDHDKRDR